MACYSPIQGYRAPGGLIKFSRSGAFRDLPITVSCGQCLGCRLERSRQWAVRSVHEASLHDRNCFLTLTYDEKNLPPNGSLDITHWQKFAKKLRKQCGPFRFLHCGEYGEINDRPHYHASIFGLDFFEGRKLYKETPQGPLFNNPLLDQIWGKGYAVFSELTFSTAAYVARYIMKKVTGDDAEWHYQQLDPITGETWMLKPEYCTMSRNPGLGAKWIEKYLDEVYPSDEVIINGKQCRPPKFYDTALEKTRPDIHATIRKARARKGQKQKQENTPSRLAVREIVKSAQLANYSRNL